MTIVTLGIDLAKHVFQLHGIDENEKTVLQKRLTRNRLLEFIAKLPSCLIGLEASSSAHYWAREFTRLGHEVRMMPAQYVKPYVKRNKHDVADAEAICEAVRRPNMRFVAIKSTEQQALLVQHRIRESLLKQRTMMANTLRSHMGEFGIVVPQGLQNIHKLGLILADEEDIRIPDPARQTLLLMLDQMRSVNEKVQQIEKWLAEYHQSNEQSQRLSTIPGVGLLSATAISATVGDMTQFRSARQFSAWLGLTPSEHSSGGKSRPGRISKRGDGYIRRLLVHGARSVVQHRGRKQATSWLGQLLARKHTNIATVALANKNARIAWALLTRQENYRPGLLTEIPA